MGYFWAEKVVLNHPRESTQAPSPTLTPASVAKSMRQLVLKMKSDHMDESGALVNYDAIATSSDYQEYLKFAEQLHYISMIHLDQPRRRAFFINIYNTLIIHALIEGFLKPKLFSTAFFTRMSMYATASYSIGGQIYSLNDIENGILRGNRPSAMWFSSVPFSVSDPRHDAVLPLDPRIHFALNCGARSCPPISVYSEEHLDRDLDRATRSYLLDGVEVNCAARSVTLSPIFKWYANDFGSSSHDILRWIAPYCIESISTQLRELLESSDAIKILYSTYNWSQNSLVNTTS